MGPRRPIALAAVAGLALAGCAQQRAGSSPAALAAWHFPREIFIPRVDAPAAGDAPRLRPAARSAPAAAAPATGADVSSGAPSDAEIRAQLRELYGSGGGDPALVRAVALSGGQAIAPPDAPEVVQRIVEAANQVARLPYVYGGGHGRADGLFVDSAYDCSGSISFALANAGLIDRPMTSGQLARWGRPGPGRWVTIFANAGHAFMVVGGARFDTVGLRQAGSRWQRPYRSVSGFTAVHPEGL